KIRRGDLKEIDYEKIKQISTELQNLPLYIDQTGGLSLGQMATRARRLKRQRGLDLLVIDYLQLLQASKRSGRDNRVQEITEITTTLKALAKELNIPILALSQLSRQVEQRENNDRSSHAMQKPDDEQKFSAWAARAEELHNGAEIIIAKHRHGPTASIELNFEP